MKKSLFFPVVFIMCLVFNMFASAHNPFITQPQKQHSAPSPIMKTKLFAKVILWQHQLREKMSLLIRQAEQTGDLLPLLYLFMAAFSYGAIHAIGPGHGKFLAISYTFSQRVKMSQGIVFGGSIALFHGLSGILFVIFIKELLSGSATQGLETMTHFTQVISYSLIICVGFFILVKSALRLLRKKVSIPNNLDSIQNSAPTNPVLSALIIGMIPCPGVVIVMLFAMSMGLIGLGVMLGLAISAGMAFTITAVVILTLSGKMASLSVASKNSSLSHIAEHLLEAVAGIMILLFGSVLLLANL
ncbi:MAG: hypothetical protein ABIK15_03735 [Pseudomonadota bacterium]